MRIALLVVAPTLVSAPAIACPMVETIRQTTDIAPATTVPCAGFDEPVEMRIARRTLDVRYSVGATGSTQTASGETATGFAGLELGFGLAFGSAEQPSYEVELSGGATAQQTTGDVSATGLVTHGNLRIGPARMNPALIDEGRGNFAALPLTWELAHVGELAARPRLAARPELSRELYNRERVELATRIIRVEGAGDKPSTTAPGSTETEEKKPSAWAIDVIPLYSGIDISMQNGTRYDAHFGGSMLGVTDHTSGISVDVFRLEHHWIETPMVGATNLDTLWVLRLDGVNPATGMRYYAGWGEVLDMPGLDELFPEADEPGQQASIGGIGWFMTRKWGGWGSQWRYEPFVTMTGEVAIESRLSAEVFVPSVFNLVARAFVANAKRYVDDRVRSDTTAGVDVEASYTRHGVQSRVALELGRTFYTTLDGAVPDRPGFAAGFGLTLQHAGGRTWTR